MSDIVSAEWLKDNLSKVRVIDASWYMPDDKRDTEEGIRGDRAYSRRGILRH